MQHKIVSHDEWRTSRTALLAKEKEFSKARDELSRQRRELPWVKIGKNYVFDTLKGKQSLADLFDSRSQLIVYHFMGIAKAFIADRHQIEHISCSV